MFEGLLATGGGVLSGVFGAIYVYHKWVYKPRMDVMKEQLEKEETDRKETIKEIKDSLKNGSDKLQTKELCAIQVQGMHGRIDIIDKKIDEVVVEQKETLAGVNEIKGMIKKMNGS